MGFLFGDGSTKIYKNARKQMEPLWQQGMASANDEAALLEEQGRIALRESEVAAQQKRREGAVAMGEISSAYLNSGVTLEGSPLAYLKDVKDQNEAEAKALMDQGIAYNELYSKKAGITRREGRSAILGSQIDFGINEARAKAAEKRAILRPLGQIGMSAFQAFLGKL